MMRVWPAAVARVREEVADMQAIAAEEGAAITIEPWDYLLLRGEGRKAKYDLDQAELKPYFELDNMVAAALWSAERRYDITFTEITGQGAGVPSRRARVGGQRRGRPGRRASRPVLPRQLRAGGQALGRLGLQLPHAAQARWRDHGDLLEQQQLRQGVAGRAGADLARRRARRCSTSSATRCTRCSRTSPTPGSRRRRATSSSTRRR